MATLGLLFIGLLFGFFLSLVTAAFLLLNLDPRLRDDLLARRRSILDLLPRGRQGGAVTSTSSGYPALEQKLRTLQEELRVTRKLLDDALETGESRRREAESLVAEVAALGQKLMAATTDRETLTAELESAREARHALAADLSLAREELARRERDVRDLSTELELSRSGDRFFHS